MKIFNSVGFINSRFLLCLTVNLIGTLMGHTAVFASSKNTYTTSIGAEFKQVEDVSFGLSWMSPDGLIWSKFLGDFSNWQKTEKESQAVKVCKDNGGELPDWAAYDRLGSYFEKDRFNHFTKQGRINLTTLFPDMENRWFWMTATHDTYVAYLFNGFLGNIDGVQINYRKDVESVRCVKR